MERDERRGYVNRDIQTFDRKIIFVYFKGKNISKIISMAESSLASIPHGCCCGAIEITLVSYYKLRPEQHLMSFIIL